MVVQLISGGQTGVDRAALDAALASGFPCGGWCPRGRRAEDGELPARYPLRETSSSHYGQRTALNVRDSDGTLVMSLGAPDRGTALTCRLAGERDKPVLLLDVSTGDPGAAAGAALRWAHGHWLETLNVAGPRESSAPGIYARAFGVMTQLVRLLQL
jgi:hypothetical protein